MTTCIFIRCIFLLGILLWVIILICINYYIMDCIKHYTWMSIKILYFSIVLVKRRSITPSDCHSSFQTSTSDLFVLLSVYYIFSFSTFIFSFDSIFQSLFPIQHNPATNNKEVYSIQIFQDFAWVSFN